MESSEELFNLNSGKLFQMIGRENPSNFVFSPFSIFTALTMVYFGANGISKKELQEFFKKMTPEDSALIVGETLNMSKTEELSGVELKGANRIYVDRSIGGIIDDPIFQAFRVVLREKLHADTELADFKNGYRVETRKINAWVESMTKNKISELLDDNALSQNTALVLVSALYFKASWIEEFKSEPSDPNWKRISNPKFTGLDANGEIVTQTGIKYMEIKKICNSSFPLGYLESNRFGFKIHVVELPYVGHRHSMVFFMPENAVDLPKLESTWYSHPSYLDEIVKLMDEAKEDQMTNIDVTLRLPSFKIGCQTISLKKHLTSLGVGTLFGDDADLTRMSSGKDLKIEDVFHQAIVDVDEKGTEAAAATAVNISLRCMPFSRSSMTINIDKAFLFQIRSRARPQDEIQFDKSRILDTILFCGKITDIQSLQK